MSSGVNKVILIGNLGQDPEVRRTSSGASVCTLRLATAERRKDASGQWVDHTEWHSVVTFGTVADNCGRFLKKGRQVFIEGRLQTRKWQDKEGKDRYTTEVIAMNVQFLGGGRGDSAGESLQQHDVMDFSSGSSAVAGHYQSNFSGGDDIDNDGGRGAGLGAKNKAPYSSSSILNAVGLKAADDVAFDDDDIPF
jgi:single-strand DNA-binding protein